MKHIQRSWFLLMAIGFGLAGSQLGAAKDIPTIKRADTLQATTPWNLDALSKPPGFEWGEAKEVRSLFYDGEPYQGKPTSVFADDSIMSELPPAEATAWFLTVMDERDTLVSSALSISAAPQGPQETEDGKSQ